MREARGLVQFFENETEGNNRMFGFQPSPLVLAAAYEILVFVKVRLREGRVLLDVRQDILVYIPGNGDLTVTSP